MHTLRKTLHWLTTAVLVAMPLAISRPAMAASANLYLSPASSSVANGSTFTVNVRENSGTDAVNAAEIHLTYPTDKLDYVSISNSSAFAIVAASSGGAGNVNIDRGATPAATGDQLIASVRFKAKVSSGSGTISFGSSSKVLSEANSQDITTGKSGSNISFSAPAAAPQADTIAPTISRPPEVTEITRNSAVVTWSTSEPSTSEVVYGLNSGYGLAASDPAMVTEHKVTLSSAILSPGTTYHYMVKSVDPAGNAVSSNDATFATKGYSLDVTVLNQNNKPVKGAKVTIENKSGTSDKLGKVTIADLPLGKLAGTVEHKAKKTTVSVTMVEPADEGKNQTATFKIETPKNIWLIIAAITAALGVLGVVGWQQLKQRRGGRGGSSKSGASSSGAGPSNNLPSSPPSTIINPTSGGQIT